MNDSLSHGSHKADDSEQCLVEAACAVAEPERERTISPGWAPVLEAYARGANDAYGTGAEADARRTVALSWAVEALPLADRSVAAEARRVWLALAWAICDAAEALDAEGVSHGLWALAIPVDTPTARAAYEAAAYGYAVTYSADAAYAAAHAAAAAVRASTYATDASAYKQVAAHAAAAAVRASAYAAARVGRADARAGRADHRRWDWCDARLPARLRVLCEVTA